MADKSESALSASAESGAHAKLAPAHSLEQLVSHLHASNAEESRKFITSLLSKGEPAGQIHAALVGARDMAAREQGLEAVVKHFDQLQAHLLAQVLHSWQENLSKVRTKLVSEAQAHMVSDACNKWLKEGYVELYNYYKEIPLIARVRLLSVQADTLHVVCSEDLVWVVAAGDQRRTVFVRVPFSEFSLRLIVKQVHGPNLLLVHGGLVLHERESRHHIRVQCNRPILISMRREKGPWWHGVIHDFSEAGLGITSEDELPWHLEETLICKFSMQDHELTCGAVVRWRSDADGKVRMGVQLIVEGLAKKALQREVAGRVKEIHDSLKIKGIPDSLASVKVPEV
jgi:hypothetical protein